MAAPETVWAIMSGTTCQGLALADAAFAQSQGWLGPYTLGAPNTPGGVGWTTPDNGVTWVAPVIPVAQANQATVVANILNRQSQIRAWITANPNGAILTAGQTLALAKMLEGLCQLLLSQFTDTNLT